MSEPEDRLSTLYCPTCQVFFRRGPGIMHTCTPPSQTIEFKVGQEPLPTPPIVHLPTEPKERKEVPIITGVFDYFPNALAEIARISKMGNDQHNPGQPLHWSRAKSGDHADCIGRHLVDRGTRDKDGGRHSAKVAWRALALLEEELIAEGAKPGRGTK